MSKNPGFGQGLEMAALKKGAGAGPIDLMRPGNGTPWEDRGSTGAAGAYIKTVIRSLFSPGLLLDHIRRPETTSDSTAFAAICGVIWAASAFVYSAYWEFVVLPNSPIYEKDVDTMYYWLSAAVAGAMIGGGVYLWLSVGSRLYRSLGDSELKGANPSLIRNCFDYCLGPSFLALVPIPISMLGVSVPVGWLIAGSWIVVDLIAAGKRRLYLKTTSAIINVLLLSVIVVVLAIVIYFAFFHLLWGSVLGMNGLTDRVIQRVATPKAAPD